jgi:hypothetical protein
MSWDIIVQDFPKDVKSAKDIPADYHPKPIGTRSEIIAKILEVVPSADFSDLSWGDIDEDGWSIEVNLGDEEVLRGFFSRARWWRRSRGRHSCDSNSLETQSSGDFQRRFFRGRAIGCRGLW